MKLFHNKPKHAIALFLFPWQPANIHDPRKFPTELLIQMFNNSEDCFPLWVEWHLSLMTEPPANSSLSSILTCQVLCDVSFVKLTKSLQMPFNQTPLRTKDKTPHSNKELLISCSTSTIISWNSFAIVFFKGELKKKSQNVAWALVTNGIVYYKQACWIL